MVCRAFIFFPAHVCMSKSKIYSPAHFNYHLSTVQLSQISESVSNKSFPLQISHIPFMTLHVLLCVKVLSPIDYKLLVTRVLVISSFIYPQYLAQCLACNRNSTNICQRINQQLFPKNTICYLPNILCSIPDWVKYSQRFPQLIYSATSVPT